MLTSRRLELKGARFPLHPNRLIQNLRLGNRCRVQRGLAPADLQRKFRVIDDASVTAITAKVKIRTHENAVNGTRLDAQRAKHELRIVDGKPVDPEALAN